MTFTDQGPPAGPVPASAGIGLRAPHYQAILEQQPAIGWLEAHSENFFGEGGAPLHYLSRLRADYPLSLHGVGLSLGSTDPLNEHHLSRLEHLVERFEPALVSEHLSWSSVDGVFANDLLPLPYTEEALAHMVVRVEQVQERLGRRLLIENPSGYLSFVDSTIPEPVFLSELVSRTGCGLLLDLNNVHVSGRNLGWDTCAYLNALPAPAVHEFHLAGHSTRQVRGCEVLIDDHGSRVSAPVWALYEFALAHFGPRPTLIEWDTRVPDLDVLVREGWRADAMIAASNVRIA